MKTLFPVDKLTVFSRIVLQACFSRPLYEHSLLRQIVPIRSIQLVVTLSAHNIVFKKFFLDLYS